MRKKNFFLTIDIDWAPDWMIKPFIDILIKEKISSTIFVTHQSDLLEEIEREKTLIEIGLHPNLNINSTQGKNTEDIINNLKQIYPRARAIRTHGNIHSTNLSLDFSHKYKFLIDSSLFIPYKLNLRPYKFGWDWKNKIINTPYTWEDSYEICQIKPKLSLTNEYFKNSTYLVLNFHPVHLYLNAFNYKKYRDIKTKYGDINYWDEDDIKKYINTKQKGVFDFFKELIFTKNIEFRKISYSKKFLQ